VGGDHVERLHGAPVDDLVAADLLAAGGEVGDAVETVGARRAGERMELALQRGGAAGSGHQRQLRLDLLDPAGEAVNESIPKHANFFFYRGDGSHRTFSFTGESRSTSEKYRSVRLYFFVAR